MREIKFRQGIFLDGKFLSWHYWGIGADDTFKGPVWSSGEKVGDSFQYTGLKDKNGKEIWEGDIITKENWQHNDGRMTTSEIKYDEGNWSYAYSLDEYMEDPEEDWEVIGNIYQQPELLREGE